MSELIKHECGVALVRLLKPLDYYSRKYGTPFHALNKMYLLMEKQRNRGHDGAGIANIKFDMKAGNKYSAIERSYSSNPIQDIFLKVRKEIEDARRKVPSSLSNDPYWLKNNVKFSGELFLGHLRYGTFGKNDIESCHPFIRENNWLTRTLIIAGNFNLTNVEELFELLIEIGQHPKDNTDTVTILEKIGHFLDEENDQLFQKYKSEDHPRPEISRLIASGLDIPRILTNTCKKWDGGYVIAGLLGHGDAFVMRDPSGIRPAYYYHDDEIAVVCSERPTIQAAFDVPSCSVKELPPAHALVIRKEGQVFEAAFTEAREKKSCSFERIYFSRGNDSDIYCERKALGEYITGRVLDEIDQDLENSVFSFIPNTAETCFYGMMEELNSYCNEIKKKKILAADGELSESELMEILAMRPRLEKVAVKDAKLRTFITNDSDRNALVANVYDITHGTVVPNVDNLVVIDDSIVRGTTLRESILRILDRLKPKKIVLVSSAPQIRYPDCYGIDMAVLDDFIAFQAAIELLKETGKTDIIDTVYRKSKAQENLPKDKVVNYVKDIYAPFTQEEVSTKISQLLRPPEVKAEVAIIYQTVENLHKACPEHLGDWYFTGDYPTPGGNKVVNKSFLNYIEGVSARAY